MRADPQTRQTMPSSTALAGMRVCRRPARCPYVLHERSLASQFATWQRSLDAALPGDAALVDLLLGDIADLALSEAPMEMAGQGGEDRDED